jgi:hypothetical protein
MVTESNCNTITLKTSDQRIVATIIQLLAGAVKHHSLYPEDHSIAKQHLAKIFAAISSLLESHNSLRFAIDKTSIVYDEDVVYEGKTDENDIAFLLGRDGVEWFEFFKDLELWEIQSLLRVINSNRRNDIEHDGNIATALWEQDFPHIEYKTIDLTAMDIPLLNLNSFRVAPGPETAADIPADEAGANADWQDYYSEAEPEDTTTDDNDQETISLALTSPDRSLWQLTELEQIQLDAMISKEAGGIDTESTIEILLILLLLQNSEQEAVDIMDFLQDRFLFCLQQQQFTHGLKILSILKKITTVENKRQKQLSPLISQMFRTVSRPESLRDLEKFFTAPDQSVSAGEMDALWKLIRLLPPNVLNVLAPLSKKIDIQRFGPPFLAVFEYYCKLDPRSFAAVAKEIDKKICLHLFPFFNRIPMEQAIPILSALALHSCPLVRSKSFQLLTQWNAVDLQKLLPLIDDPNETIRQTILSMAGRERNATIERMLCQHLQEHAGETEDRKHILACYHALGKAGSELCIPFLKKCLFQGSRLGTLFASGGGAHKEGAARALIDLRNTEARQIVREGATSIIPDVRAACRKALGARHA